MIIVHCCARQIYHGQYLPQSKVGIVFLTDAFFSSAQCTTELSEMSAQGLTIISLRIEKYDK